MVYKEWYAINKKVTKVVIPLENPKYIIIRYFKKYSQL